MKNIRNRAKDLFPSVSMTLLSIIQALALEFLWDQIHDSRYLWTFGWPAVLGWLQLLTTMLGILQIWLFNTSVAMRFRWTPHARDLMLPLAVGVLEFILIDLTGTQYLAWWFVDLAVVYTLAAWISQDIFLRARLDSDNEEYFRDIRPAQRVDLVVPVGTVAAYLVFAAAISLLPDYNALAVTAIGFAAISLGYRVIEARRYWNMSMGLT